MTVLQKLSGTLPSWALDGTVLTLGGTFSLDIADLMQNESAHIFISRDEEGVLCLGPARRYIAELELPARRYAVEKIGFTDDHGFPALRLRELPPDMDGVTLTLWPEEERV